MRDKAQEVVRKDGLKPVEGINPSSVFTEHPNYEQLQPVMENLGDIIQQAIYAQSDEEALRIINETRTALINAGIEEVEADIAEQAQEGTEFMRYRTSN